MYLCFADESGTPPKPAKRNPRPYFVIAAVFIPITQWHSIAQELLQLKQNPAYRIRGEIKWRYFGAHNDDPRNTVAHLDAAARDNFRQAFYGILTRRNSVKVVATVAKVANCYRTDYINTEHDLYAYTYKPVSERFQYFLQDLGRTTGATQYGVIVGDHRGRTDDERLRREHQRFVHSTSPYVSNYSQIAESLFLTPSNLSVGVQFADMVAGAVARRFNDDDSRWLDVIDPAFRRSPTNAIEGYGLVKMPNNW